MPKSPVLNYEVLAGAGRPNKIVMLHGLLASRRYFQRLADALAERYEVIGVDLMGFGDSPKPKDFSYTPEAHTDALAEMLEQAGIANPVTVLGHSMGGVFALWFAERYGERVSQLIVNGSPVHETPREGRQTISAASPGTRTLSNKWIGPVSHGLICKTPILANAARLICNREGLALSVAADTPKHTAQSYITSIHEIIDRPGRVPQMIKNISQAGIPVTYVIGRDDVWVTPARREQLEQLASSGINPSFRVEYVPGGHHTPQVHPVQLAQLVD